MWLQLALVFFLLYSGEGVGAAMDALPRGYRMPGAAASSSSTCEPINRVPLCNDTPYNYTRYPNIAGHIDQLQAAEALKDYEPLIVRYTCHPNLKFFLCSVFTPMCSSNLDDSTSVTSCQSVCEDVMRSCLPLLQRIGLSWPEALNCSRFPKSGELCMDPHEDSGSQLGGGATGRSKPQPDPFDNEDMQKLLGSIAVPSENNNKLGGQSSTRLASSHCSSRDYFTLSSPASAASAGAAAVTSASCVQSCHRDVRFDHQGKTSAELLMSVYAPLCFLVAAFVVLTFCLDKSRFRYPVRPVIFIALCYALFALGHIVRLIRSSSDSNISCVLDSRNHCRYLVEGSLALMHWQCIIVFVLLYFSSIASSLWFLMLALVFAVFFLSSNRKRTSECIEARWNPAIHVVTWTSAAIFTTAALVTNRVDGDELTGLCFIGNSDSFSLSVFVIAPRAIAVTLGACFIIAGFVGAARIKRRLGNGGEYTNVAATETTGASGTPASLQRPTSARNTNNIGNEETLLARLGSFCLFYIVAELCVLGCNVYQKVLLDSYWQPRKQAYCEAMVALGATGSTGGLQAEKDWRPRLEIFVLKIVMSLVMALVSGMWVCSRKTVYTWARFLRCSSRCWTPPATIKQPLQQQQQQQSALLLLPSGTSSPPNSSNPAPYPSTARQTSLSSKQHRYFAQQHLLHPIPNCSQTSSSSTTYHQRQYRLGTTAVLYPSSAEMSNF